MANQLPLPRQVPHFIIVAEIECENKFGKFTSPVWASPTQSVGEAITERELDLRSRGNTILSIRRIVDPYENTTRILAERKKRQR
jgi:hypothetical protein